MISAINNAKKQYIKFKKGELKMSSDNGNKICFLHAGTHKTGTTSLQYILKKNEKYLLSKGFYIPKTGLTFPDLASHYNIAYELTGDEMFNPKFGTLLDLKKELEMVHESNLILSSENFEHLYWKREQLERLKQIMESSGFTVYVVMYFRDIVSYASSLYTQLLKMEYEVSEEKYIEEILVNGTVTWKKNLIYCFEYQKIVQGFADVFGNNNIISLKYSNNIESSFFKLLNLDIPLYEKVKLNNTLKASKIKKILIYNKLINKLNVPDSISKYGRRFILSGKGPKLPQEHYIVPFYLSEKLQDRFKETVKWQENLKLEPDFPLINVSDLRINI